MDEKDIPQVKKATWLGGHRVSLEFTDGRSGEIDFSGEFESRTGILKALADTSYFAKLFVDEDAGTLGWPNGEDLDPVVLWSKATGLPITDIIPWAETLPNRQAAPR